MGTLRSRLGYAAVVIAVLLVAERLNDLLWRLDAFRGLHGRSAEAAGALVSVLEVSLCLLAIALTLLKGRIWRSERTDPLRPLPAARV